MHLLISIVFLIIGIKVINAESECRSNFFSPKEAIDQYMKDFNQDELKQYEVATIFFGQNQMAIANYLSGTERNIQELMLPDESKLEPLPIVMKSHIPNTAYIHAPKFNYFQEDFFDATGGYFLKEVVKIIPKVKLVLIVDHSVVRKDANPMSFLKLMEPIVNFVNSIDNIKIVENSFGLIIKNLVVDHNPDFTDIPENTFKRYGEIIDYLKNLNLNLNRKIDAQTNDTKLFYEITTKLLDPVINNFNENMEHVDSQRIAAYRKPDYDDTDSSITPDFNFIENIIENVLQPFEVNSNFGSMVSRNTLDYIQNTLIKIYECMVQEIGTDHIKQLDIIRHNMEVITANDLNHIRNDVEHMHHVISDMVKELRQFETVEEFQQILAKYFEILHNQPPSSEGLKYWEPHIYLLNHLKNNLNNNINNLNSILIKPYEEFLDKLNDEYNFFSFLANLYIKMNQYDVHEKLNAHNFNNRIGIYKKLRELQLNIHGTPKTCEILKDLLEEIYESEIKFGFTGPTRDFDLIRNIVIDKSKKILLLEIFDMAIDSLQHLKIEAPNSKKLIIKGVYLKLSDIVALEAYENISELDILVLKKLFIDVDIKKVMNKHFKFFIMGPEIEVVNRREIYLAGEDGEEYISLSRRLPIGDPRIGVHGVPGNPGYTGGAMIMLTGKVINAENLNILSVGGAGSNGENGYRGDYTFYKLPNGPCYDKDNEGKDKSGNGGDGGKGGSGGKHGHIDLKILNDHDHIKFEERDGLPGKDGKGGSRGFVYETLSDVKYTKLSEKHRTSCGGSEGKDGANTEDMKPSDTENYVNREEKLDASIPYFKQHTINFNFFLKPIIQGFLDLGS